MCVFICPALLAGIPETIKSCACSLLVPQGQFNILFHVSTRSVNKYASTNCIIRSSTSICGNWSKRRLWDELSASFARCFSLVGIHASRMGYKLNLAKIEK